MKTQKRLASGALRRPLRSSFVESPQLVIRLTDDDAKSGAHFKKILCVRFKNI
jgi:hypothetical protein